MTQGNMESESYMFNNVEVAICMAREGRSKLSQGVLDLNGYSSPMVRHFLNNLIWSFEENGLEPNYLEVGLHRGSTFVSALFGNRISDAYGVDNFSEFDTGTVRQELNKNIRTFLRPDPLHVLDVDCFSIDPATLLPIDVFFYDGNHSYESQKKAITHFSSALETVSIIIVDDYNWDYVRKGTEDGLRDSGLLVKNEWLLFSEKEGDPDSWWNGLGVFLVYK